MIDNFRILTREEEKKLTKEELKLYCAHLKEFLSSSEYSDYTEKQMARREKLNPIIKGVLNLVLKYPIIADGYENIPDGPVPVIYACSHQDFYDVINSIYTYPEHVLTLNAINIRWLLKKPLRLNGVRFMDRADATSRNLSKIETEKSLFKGKSTNVYSEATLNCTPSKPHLPFYIGIIDIAMKTGCPIIPVVQEYTYDETILDGKTRVKSVHVRFGKPVYVSINDDKIEKLHEFDEKFSTVRWQLIEEKGLHSRAQISNKLYTNYIETRKRDWRIPGNDIKEERKAVYSPYDDPFHYVNDVEYDEEGNFIPTEHVRKLTEIENNNKERMLKQLIKVHEKHPREIHSYINGSYING